MDIDSRPLGRRERNKLDKLERITAIAAELFANRGIDDVTTQEIAERADIGTGTLFLYAKTKSELLLLVQNSAYASALEKGRIDAGQTTGVLDGVVAIVRPVVQCNRSQVENGRTYLREIVFGDPNEPHHSEALGLTLQTEALVSKIVAERAQVTITMADNIARIVSSIMFVSMASSANLGKTVEQIIDEIVDQVRVVLPD